MPCLASFLDALTNCREKFPGGIAASKTSSFTTVGGGINLDVSIDYNGRTYYKVSGTGNAFFDRFAYMTFRVTDTGQTEVSYPLAPVIPFYNNATGELASQGVIISDIAMLFTQPPVEISTSILKLGVVHLSVSSTNPPTNPFVEQQSVLMNVTIRPTVETTCRVNDLDVSLPKVPASSFRTLNDESGRTNFTVVIACGSAIANAGLNAELVDNGNISNIGNILSNTGSAENVGVKVYNPTNNQAINFHSSFDFGHVNANGTSTKQFYAQYAATSEGAVTAGTVNSTATLNLPYK